MVQHARNCRIWGDHAFNVRLQLPWITLQVEPEAKYRKLRIAITPVWLLNKVAKSAVPWPVRVEVRNLPNGAHPWLRVDQAVQDVRDSWVFKASAGAQHILL
jgi:hypothetical protein